MMIRYADFEDRYLDWQFCFEQVEDFMGNIQELLEAIIKEVRCGVKPKKDEQVAREALKKIYSLYDYVQTQIKEADADCSAWCAKHRKIA